MTEIYKGFEQKVPPTPDALETNLADFNPVCIREIILQLADAGLLHVSSTTGQILPATSAENITPALLIGIFMHDGSATADRS
jgi:hypothetical protein